MRLSEQQSRFAGLVLDAPRAQDGEASLLFMDERGIAPAERIAIYRRAVFARLEGTLSATYPAVVKIVGEGYFSKLAREFIALKPPAGGCLYDYGGGFAAFLEGQDRLEEHALAYLPDVARLEWALSESEYAADDAPLENPGEDPASRAWPLRLSVRLMRSSWPVLGIREFCLRTEDEDRGESTFDVDGGPQCALVHRPLWSAQAEEISEAEYELLTDLGSGRTLGQAAERVARLYPAFDLGGALSRFAALHIFAAR